MSLRHAIVLVAFVLPVACARADALQDAVQAVQRKDYATAVRLLGPLAEAGNARAQTQLGLLYHHGQGVPESDAQAVVWFDRAARQGYLPAQVQLGNMYAYGHATVPAGFDPMHLAAQWYFEAARKGNADAQYALGLLFLTGSGVVQNNAEARKWLGRAARQGHADARSYLRGAGR
ncbi:MAG TPA: tetratricopeptide repeat protein [Burkholderiaceae bacterium]|nr:tetratricopeptide repeat protein [Burkholderiaceae bacterium]